MINPGKAPLRLQRIVGPAQVLRPVNLIITAAGVWLGATLSGSQGSDWMGLWAMVAAVALTAAGNAHNDWSDLDKDAVNRPDRPLPAGRISPTGLLVVSGGAFVAGLLALMPLSRAHAALFGMNAGILLLYNRWGSRRLLAGNVMVAALVGSTLFFGALASGITDRVVVAAAFAAAATLAREMIKDVQDLEGDRLAGARTLAVVAGPDVSSRLVNLVLFLLVSATPLPFLFLDFGGTYLLGMAITSVLLLRATLRGAPAHSSLLLKWAMVTGTLALLFADIPVT
jgi:geranylgeranylglycerol-phosphate geranylgeranyltransferase